MASLEERIIRCEDMIRSQRETADILDKKVKDNIDKVELANIINAGIKSDLGHICESIREVKDNDLSHICDSIAKLEAKQDEMSKTLNTLVGQNIALISVVVILIGAVLYMIFK